MRYRPKGEWRCSKDCDVCEGKGVIEVGMEGFINSRMEQDCRDILEPCENAEFIEPDYDKLRDEQRDK